MTYRLAPNPVFWTVQGEGALLGEPMAFVRLAGCSVGCAKCDTNYSFGSEATAEQILTAIRNAVPQRWPVPWVWVTGGEPTDQDIQPLLDLLRTCKYRVALATSGVRALSREMLEAINWLSVSPHAPVFAQRTGHEVKLVPGLGGLTWQNLPLQECGSFPYKYIQPLGTRDEAARGVEFVTSVPGWRLSPQAHKSWRIA